MSFRIGRRTPNGDCATPDREAWIVPPRLLTAGEGGDRHASWLELFFDLVFVVAITELSAGTCPVSLADGLPAVRGAVHPGVCGLAGVHGPRHPPQGCTGGSRRARRTS